MAEPKALLSGDLRDLILSTDRNGAREPEVEEPAFAARSVLFELEVDEVAEPKALGSVELTVLIKKHGSFLKASKAVGASEAFVRQNIKNKIRRPSGK